MIRTIHDFKVGKRIGILGKISFFDMVSFRVNLLRHMVVKKQQVYQVSFFYWSALANDKSFNIGLNVCSSHYFP